MSCHSIKNGNDQSVKFNSNNYSYPLIKTKNHITSKSKLKQTTSYPTNLIPFKRLQKIKKVNKKIKSIEKGKSKELNNILLKYKFNRDFQLNFLTNELKTKLSNLRRLAHEKQSFILKENQQQTKLLHKRIIKDLQKIKEKLLRNTHNNNTTMDHIKQEIETIFNDSVSNVNHLSSRRITRNRAKTQLIHNERRKNIDFTKYKFGLTPLDITSDLKYLIIKEKQLNNDIIPPNNNDIFDEFDDYDYDNISIGFISHPMGFLNDRHLFASQLTGIYKKRAKRITSVKSRRIIKEMFGNENNYNDMDVNNEHDRNDNDNHNGNVYGQICVFEKADEVDNDYVMNGRGSGNNGYDNDDEILKNAVYINNVRFTSGDRIRIIEHNYNGSGRNNIECGVIKCIMKYHMKIIVGGYDMDKPKRIRYKDINQGHVSVFLQA